MDSKVLDYLADKMDSRRDSRRDSRGYRDSRRGDSRSGRGTVDFEGNMDFEDSKRSEMWKDDERYDSRDSRDYRDYRDSRDSRDRMPMNDSRDYGKAIKLSKTDIHHWKQMMENEDGTRGPHYDMQQIISAAEKLNVKFDEFDEKEFCIAVNMMYSDYCKIVRKYVAPDKELMFFAELAKAFLDDEDGPEASEKLALYFHCIVDA